MKKYLDQDGTKHLVRKLDESIDKKIQNTVKNATATEAGLVRVLGVPGESAPYTVYSTVWFDGKINEFEEKMPSEIAYQVDQLEETIERELGGYQPKPTDGSKFLTDKDISLNPGGVFYIRGNKSFGKLNWIIIKKAFIFDFKFKIDNSDISTVNNGSLPIAKIHLPLPTPFIREVNLDTFSVRGGLISGLFKMEKNGVIFKNTAINTEVYPNLIYSIKGIEII